MATANPLREDQKSNFELELSRVREKIKTKFVDLFDCMKARESALLKELDGILANYQAYLTEYESVKEKRIAIEKAIIYNQNELASSQIKSVYKDIIKRLNTELKSFRTPIELKMVCFECDSNKMLAELNKLGKLVEKVRIGIDYKSKKQPLVSICERGNVIGKLNLPRDVIVDSNSGNIYVSDQGNDCVKVFDSTGKCLFKFGDIEGKGKMNNPLSLAIYGDRILISQGSNCILNYRLNGSFISKIGKPGNGELEFDWPTSLTIDDSNGDIYVCEYINGRIQVLSQKFCFISQFGNYTLGFPHDVKLSKEYIYVLDVSNPCLHLFSYNYILQKSVISRGEAMEVNNPWYFFIDQTDNILFTDYISNSIHIFNNEFQLIHKISVSPHPMGITVDNRGRVIVVCWTENNCLQIY